MAGTAMPHQNNGNREPDFSMSYDLSIMVGVAFYYSLPKKRRKSRVVVMALNRLTSVPIRRVKRKTLNKARGKEI